MSVNGLQTLKFRQQFKQNIVKLLSNMYLLTHEHIANI